jgi:hypothetical protein
MSILSTEPRTHARRYRRAAHVEKFLATAKPALDVTLNGHHLPFPPWCHPTGEISTDDLTPSRRAGLFTDLVADHATYDRAADCAHRATACKHSTTDGAYPGTSSRVDASLGHAGATQASNRDNER